MNTFSNSELIIESQSLFSFEATIIKLNTIIIDTGWKLPAVHDLQTTIKNFGKDILPIKVFEVCHPRYSSRLLELDNERIVSTFMPCRISVYEKSDGKTYISRFDGIKLSSMFGGLVEEVMTAANSEMEEMIGQLLKD